jgi:hypothetical protein
LPSVTNERMEVIGCTVSANKRYQGHCHNLWWVHVL